MPPPPQKKKSIMSLVNKVTERAKNVRKTSFPAVKKCKKEEPHLDEKKVPAVSLIVPTPSPLTVRFGGARLMIDAEMADDIDKYMRNLEKKSVLPPGFLSNRQVTGNMREIVVDWFVRLQMIFDFHDETLSLAVSVMDRALHKLQDHEVDEGNYQLLSMVSMWIAAKFEEIYFPRLEDILEHGCPNGVPEVIEMERKILNAIGFDCSIPYHVQFVRRFAYCAKAPDQVRRLAKFIAEVGMLNYSLCHLKPSTLAAVSFYLAAHILDFPLSRRFASDVMMMCEHTCEFHESPLRSLARKFVAPVLELSGADAKLQGLRQKHSQVVSLKFDEEQVRRMKRL